MTGNRIDENMQWHHDETDAPDASTASDEEKNKELRASMLSLFNNLPVSAFAKCIETGRYLACNQAFAESVHKKSPAEVAGLTDDDLFDPKTADQMRADDRLIVSMDEPCVLYEDVLDAPGVSRRLRITKQKFIDESGRACLMGLSVDVTETKGMSRTAAQLQEENATDSWEKANKDALTGVKNKHSFDNYTDKFQKMIDQGELPEVAIGAFDCDNLGKINEQYGLEKGNLCLLASCRLICKVFKHSPVFRVGGDEFAVILQGEDYHNIDGLLQQFQEMQNEIVSSAKRPWEKVRVSFGIAVYCPRFDGSVKDLIRRADQLMKDNKPTKKE